MKVMLDHVQRDDNLGSSIRNYRLVKYLKGTVSRLLGLAFPNFKRELPGLWTKSSFVATTGRVPLERIQRYAEGQMNR